MQQKKKKKNEKKKKIKIKWELGDTLSNINQIQLTKCSATHFLSLQIMTGLLESAVRVKVTYAAP